MKTTDPDSRNVPSTERPENSPKSIYPDRKSMSVRLGRTLHKKMMRHTRRAQISANQYITRLIEQDLERRQAEEKKEAERRQAETNQKKY